MVNVILKYLPIALFLLNNHPEMYCISSEARIIKRGSTHNLPPTKLTCLSGWRGSWWSGGQRIVALGQNIEAFQLVSIEYPQGTQVRATVTVGVQVTVTAEVRFYSGGGGVGGGGGCCLNSVYQDDNYCLQQPHVKYVAAS